MHRFAWCPGDRNFCSACTASRWHGTVGRIINRCTSSSCTQRHYAIIRNASPADWISSRCIHFCDFPLNPLVARIYSINFAAWINGYICRIVKLTFSITCAAPLVNISSINSEALNPVIIAISYVDLIVAVDCNALRMIQLTVIMTKASPLTKKAAISIKFLNAMIDAIRDIDMIVTIDRYS
ncbi:hypothetical protein D3C73_717580 [compost metagenome]